MRGAPFVPRTARAPPYRQGMQSQHVKRVMHGTPVLAIYIYIYINNINASSLQEPEPQEAASGIGGASLPGALLAVQRIAMEFLHSKMEKNNL